VICCFKVLLARISFAAAAWPTFSVDRNLLIDVQVAKSMMRGMERGAYHLPSPDLGHNVMVAASAGLSPHMFNALLEFLLSPFVVVALRIFGLIVDNAVRKHAKDYEDASQ
jgi:hypothetical protein